METNNAQLEKAANPPFLFGKYQKKQNQVKPLISLRGILKGVNITEKQLKAARTSLFKS